MKEDREREEFRKKRRVQLLEHMKELETIKQRIEYSRGFRMLLDNTGSSFVSGLVLGSLLHFGVTALNSPLGTRLHDGAASARMHAPKMGGLSFCWGVAIWSRKLCALFCCIITRRY